MNLLNPHWYSKQTSCSLMTPTVEETEPQRKISNKLHSTINPIWGQVSCRLLVILLIKASAYTVNTLLWWTDFFTVNNDMLWLPSFVHLFSFYTFFLFTFFTDSLVYLRSSSFSCLSQWLVWCLLVWHGQCYNWPIHSVTDHKWSCAEPKGSGSCWIWAFFNESIGYMNPNTLLNPVYLLWVFQLSKNSQQI